MDMDLTETVVAPIATPATQCIVCHGVTGPVSVDQACGHSLCWQCIRSMIWSERRTKVPGNACPVCTERNHHSEPKDDEDTDDDDEDTDDEDEDTDDESDEDEDEDEEDDNSEAGDHSARPVALSIKNSRVNMYF